MKDNNFCETIKSFQSSLNIKLEIDSKSDNTIKAYNRTYRDFIKFCEQYNKELSFESIKEDDIYAFIQYKSNKMDKQGSLSTSSKNSVISHLKRLFKHIERNSDEGYDFDKVFEDIKLKQPTRVPKGISDKDFKKIINYLEGMKINETFINFRNILLFKFLLYGGLRASEAVSVCLSNIELENDSDLYKISFIGKGDKNRVTFINKDIIEDEIKTLLDVFEINPEEPIATTSTGGLMDRIQLSKMVNSIYKRVGIKVTGVHILRHTAAKRLLDAGVSIVVVQSLLGHSSIQTTSIYANPTESIIKKELAKKND